MTLWYTSTELQATGCTAAAKPAYTAAGLERGYALGLGLERAVLVAVEAEASLLGLSDLSDTSG